MRSTVTTRSCTSFNNKSLAKSPASTSRRVSAGSRSFGTISEPKFLACSNCRTVAQSGRVKAHCLRKGRLKRFQAGEFLRGAAAASDSRSASASMSMWYVVSFLWLS